MRRKGFLFAIACGVFVIDRWSKWAVETRLTDWDTRVIVPGFFNIVSSRNAGAAFGIFQESTAKYRTPMLIAFALIALAILLTMLWRAERVDGRTASGLALIFGGAAGNLFDRIRTGVVTDFLDFQAGGHHWYTFNLADSAICAGAGLLLLSMIKPGTHAS